MDDFSELIKKVTGENLYFTTNINVRWEEMDANGHINYGTFLNYYSEARIEAIGHDLFEQLRKDGIGPFIYKAEIDYFKELFHPDTAHIVTWIDEIISRTRVTVRQSVFSVKRKELVSSAKFYAIFMDTRKRKPVALPESVKQKFHM